MKSKLFTPSIMKRHSVSSATEIANPFMNPPSHAEISRFEGPCDQGNPHFPLKLNGGGSVTRTVKQRTFKSHRGDFDY